MSLSPKGVWNDKEEVQEMTIFLDQLEMTISLLIYPRHAPYQTYENDEEDGLEDTYTRFTKFS